MTPLSCEQIQTLLADNSRTQLEQLAQKAQKITRQHFGRAISLYTPLYLSNHCSSHCIYCGFHQGNKINRLKLTPHQIDEAMQTIAATGIKNILLLTGESPQITPLAYLKTAVTLAGKYFQNISLETYPLSENEYRDLFLSGTDGVTVYQETYNKERYKTVHLSGQKTDYIFRRNTPARAARAGMRGLSLGILLGLGPLAEDLFALYAHLREMEHAFPGIEYSLSFPRLRTINSKTFVANTPNDDTLIRILCLTRILFPRVGINLSTRESAFFRNHALEISVTRISVGSKTTVGGYLKTLPDNAPQFDISDTRNTKETIEYLKTHNFDPVFTDWRKIQNI